MIVFNCGNCGQKFRMPDARAGKKGRCPKCRSVILVPAATAGTEGPTAVETEGSGQSPYNLTFLDAPQQPTPAAESPDQSAGPDAASQDPHELLLGYRRSEPEPLPKRTLPWIIDIFLYPLSKPCLITLAIVIILPLLLTILQVLAGPFWMFVFYPGLIVRAIIILYLYWYIAECIRDSAGGGLRGPETMGNAPSLGDMFWQMVYMIGCFAVFFVPLLIYYVRVRQADAIFWSLTGFAAFFFPMGLLAVIMFDSFWGLNPIVIVGSIISTFLPYCALVCVFFAVGYVFYVLELAAEQSFVLPAVLFLGCFYLIFVAAHLLGRFYFRYQEKLNWEV